MAWDGIWRPDAEPRTGEQVRHIQQEALERFGSYAKPLGVTVSGVYETPTSEFVGEYQDRKNASGYLPRLPANPKARRGDCDYETKKALGILPGAVLPPGQPNPQYVGYAVPGTWGMWNVGPHCMAVNRRPDKVFLQGVQFNTGAFLSPDPRHSYVEARDEGVGELLRLALPDPRKKFIAGYSMGADVVTRFLHAWPAERRHEIVQVFKFGDPGQLVGTGVRGGAISANGGIAGVFTPEWAIPITNSYLVSGDMYGDAPGLLRTLYDILTRMEMSMSFMLYLFGWLTGIQVGGFGANTNVTAPANSTGLSLLGLAGSMLPGFGALSGILGMVTGGSLSQTAGPISLPAMLLNLPAIVSTLIAALKFVFTGAHGKYWGDNRLFDGMNAEDHAASVVHRLAA